MSKFPDVGEGPPQKRETRRIALAIGAVIAAVIVAVVIVALVL